MSDFRSMFRYLREREGYSQADLARKLNVSSSTISMWECGNREPEIETLEIIADFFAVNAVKKSTAKAMLPKTI